MFPTTAGLAATTPYHRTVTSLNMKSVYRTTESTRKCTRSCCYLFGRCSVVARVVAVLLHHGELLPDDDDERKDIPQMFAG